MPAGGNCWLLITNHNNTHNGDSWLQNLGYFKEMLNGLNLDKNMQFWQWTYMGVVSRIPVASP